MNRRHPTPHAKPAAPQANLWKGLVVLATLSCSAHVPSDDEGSMATPLVVEGTWEAVSDTSSDNFTFVVENNAIRSLWYGFSAEVTTPNSKCTTIVVCPGDHVKCGQRDPVIPISNGKFVVDDSDPTLSFHIAGSFDSDSTATGSYSTGMATDCGRATNSATFTAARID